MQMTRRMFTKQAGTGLLVLATGCLTMDGCSFAQDILAWAPLGLAAFNAVITMLETFGIITADPALVIIVAAVRTGFADLVQDVKLYEAIKPPPSGALAEISAVLTLIAGNIKDLFATIQTSFAPVINLIIGLVQLILGTIAGFVNTIGPQPGMTLTTATMANSFKFSVNRQTVNYVPLKMSPAKFKHDWNAICTSQGHKEMFLI
jgi:hypothetical protein